MSSIAIAIFGFLVWGHHMFVSGQSGLADAIFSALTFSVAIPSAIKVLQLDWRPCTRGDIRLNTPMLYALMFLITVHDRRPDRPPPGDARRRRAPARHLLRRRALPLRDDGRHGDRAASAGSTTGGRRCSASCSTSGSSRIGAGLVVRRVQRARSSRSSSWAATGMPRRYYDYLPQFEIYPQDLDDRARSSWPRGSSSIAYYLAALAVPRKRGADEPVGRELLEWHTASPPPHDNFTDDARGRRSVRLREHRVEDTAHGSFAARTYEGASVMSHGESAAPAAPLRHA